MARRPSHQEEFGIHAVKQWANTPSQSSQSPKNPSDYNGDPSIICFYWKVQLEYTVRYRLSPLFDDKSTMGPLGYLRNISTAAEYPVIKEESPDDRIP
ncbi:hypothetical protein RvY_17560 [Ramazzottius varieornatus]|uniref:Uncharacterized protein n=1 Tax=Ramazzottius varieornatus TaxID=947166 RepID=A0A1D1W8B8_RAMVA|nr:hypothetical protein RvY_17560 [Ramazzottius varieornatus]